MALALQRQAVRPDALRTESFAPYLRQFRAFLGNDRLSQVHVKVKERLADGNRFRELVLRQKLPWLDAFEYYDRATLRGARPLRALDSPREVWLAAMAGLALGRVGATLSDTLKESMRVRLLSLDGRAWPVLMEWDAAHFYLRHGHRLVWTEHGQRGPEFRCERNGLQFDVECKRVGRHVAEKTGDRTALGLCYAVARAFDALNLGGEVVLETPLTNEEVVEADVIARIRAVYEQGVNGARMDLGPIGVLSGTIRRRNNHPNPGMLRQLDRHIHSVPAGGRFSAITLPIGSNRPQDHLFLEIRGPRRSDEEVFEHLERELMGGGEQFPGDVPGVLIMEFEGIGDVRAFGAEMYDAVATRVFQRFPAVAAVVWRCRRELSGQGLIEQWGLAHRNRECVFPAALAIVLDD